MNINLSWHDKEPENLEKSLIEIAKRIKKGFNEGDLCEQERDYNGKMQELRGWWRIDR